MRIFKTFAFMAVLTALLMYIGNIFGGRAGMMMALGFSVLTNAIGYWFSDKMVLAMYGAKEVSPEEAPELHEIVAELAAAANIPKPRIYIIDNPTPNAFATGRSPRHAAVAVTTGIMHMLNRAELKGVLAHELSHIRHYDILIGSIAGTIVGAISMLAYIGRWAVIFGTGRDDNDGGFGELLLLILAPLIATLIQLAISRQREYAADAGAAKLTGDPEALASALEKLAYGNQHSRIDAGPATAHMFIVNPLSGKALMNLFSTHPPIEERIERLRRMAREGIRV